ncbi:hypothetical protein ABPG72_004697 [Tetrahymena utriculariae]
MLDMQKSNSSDVKNPNNRRVVPFNQQFADCDIQAVSFKTDSITNNFNQVEEKNNVQFLQESNLQLTSQQSKNKKQDTQCDETTFKTFFPTNEAVEQTALNPTTNQNRNQILANNDTSTQQKIRKYGNKLQKQNTLNTTFRELCGSNFKQKENTIIIQQSEYLSHFNSGSITHARRESKILQSKPKDSIFGNALMIKKFINKLKAKTTNYMLNLLTYNIFELIYDKSTDYNQFINQRQLKQKDKEKTLIHKLYIRTAVANASAPNITWITKLQEVTEITNLTVSQIYVSALYWSIITMVTLGYGDIVPISRNEKLFVIFIAFVSCGLFGYSFNLISEIINESQKNKNKIKNDLEVLNNLIEERGLCNELKSKVRRYFEYLYKEKLKNTEVGYEMIGALPPNLKDEVMNDLYSKVLKQYPLFSKNFSDQFIAELSLTMKELKVGPELIILKKQQIQDKLYFILNGEVNSYWEKLPNTNTTIEQLTKGAAIGLQEFITQTPTEYFYKSEALTTLGYIEFSEFQETLKKHPKDYVKLTNYSNQNFLFIQQLIKQKETYYKIKDKLSIYREGGMCRLFCRFCKKSVHSSDQCTLITYQPNINKIVHRLKQLEFIQQDREKYERSEKQKQNSRLIFTIINDNANKAANDLVNNQQKSIELNEQSKQENIESFIQNQENKEKLSIFQGKENKIEEMLQSIRQRRITYQQNLVRRISIEASHLISHNAQFFYQKQSSKTQSEQEETFGDYQHKQNSIDNLPQIEKINEYTAFQKNQNILNQLEEIKEILPNQSSNQNDGEGSQYFSYKDQSFSQQDKINQDQDEDSNQNFDKIQTFNFIFVEPSSNKSYQNNQIQQNSPNKTRSQFYDQNSQNQLEKCTSDNKLVLEDATSTKCFEKSKTFTNLAFDSEHIARLHKKKLSNIFPNLNVNIFDTPFSQKFNKRRTSYNNQLNLLNMPSQSYQQQQLSQISPTHSQTNFQQLFFEEEYQLPFILLNDFDKLQNYLFYFPHNNPRLILRNVEDQRLQRIERQRKLKSKKNQSEKSKFGGPNIFDKKN